MAETSLNRTLNFNREVKERIITHSAYLALQFPGEKIKVSRKVDSTNGKTIVTFDVSGRHVEIQYIIEFMIPEPLKTFKEELTPSDIKLLQNMHIDPK